MKELFEEKIDLLRFDGEGEGDKGGEGAEDTKGTGADDKGGEEEKKPFATFPDEKSFMSRVGREAKKQLQETLKALGIDNEDTLKSIVTSKKEAEEKSKTDLEKAIEKANTLEAANKTAIEKANGIAKVSEAKVQAMSLGVKPEKIQYLLKLADLNDIEVNDGVVDVDALKEAIEKVLTDMPEFKATQETKPTADKKGGGDFKGNQGKLLSHEIIRNMSSKEIAERIVEVRDFLKNNPIK